MTYALFQILHPLRWLPTLVVATVVSLGVAGASAQGSSAPTQAPAATVSKSDQEIIDTLQLAYQSYPVPQTAENFAGKEVWELYNVNEDPTEMNDLASQHPVRLARIKALFDKEAKANNVYPLINWSDLAVGITDFQRKAGLLPAAPKQ